MFKKLGIIFQILAFAIVLGHSLTPHQHNVNVVKSTCAEIHESDSILDFLAEHLFHANTGVDHLENFKTAKQIFTPVYIIPALAEIVFQEITQIPIPEKNLKSYSPPHLNPFPLRGPPSLV